MATTETWVHIDRVYYIPVLHWSISCTRVDDNYGVVCCGGMGCWEGVKISNGV